MMSSDPGKKQLSSGGAGGAGKALGVQRPRSWRRSLPQSSGQSRPSARPRSLTASGNKEEQWNAAGTGRGPAATGSRTQRDPGDDGKDLLHFQDVREELELSGHNLTSVLNNPRETFMDSLYEAAFEAEPPIPDLDVLLANSPQGLKEVNSQDIESYIRRTAALTRAFEHNHGVSTTLGQPPESQRGARATPRGGSNATFSRSGRGNVNNAAGTQESPRHSLGLRRLRNEGAAGAADAKGASALASATTATVTAGGSNAATRSMGPAGSNGVASVEDGVARDIGRGSVAQCFEQVPSMFFDKSFSLQDPAVFEEAVMAAGAEQPERLAHYLDLVEVCLLKQISHRSNAFFEGLKTSQDLQLHVAGACTTLYQLRESMRRMEKDVHAGPMRVPQLQRRRTNLMALEATLELVAGVEQAPAAVQALLAAEDYLGALDILHSAKSTLKNELGKLQNLKNVGRQLAEYEELVSELLSNRFVNLAVTIPVDTAAELAASRSGADNPDNWEMDAEGTPDEESGGRDPDVGADERGGGDELRRNLELVVQGLLRLGETERVLGVVQERVSEDLKLIIRTVVGDFLATSDDSGELMDTFHLFSDETSGAERAREGQSTADEAEQTDKGTGPSGGQKMPKLKTLDGEAFCSCLEMCFEHMLSALARVSQIHAALASIVDACQRPGEESYAGGPEGGGGNGAGPADKVQTRDSASNNYNRNTGDLSREAATAGKKQRWAISAEEGAAIVEKSRGCLRALSELMERSVSQLLSVRREHNCTKLDVGELKHLWDITVTFTQAVKRLSGCNGYKLRSTLLSQAKAFVEARHEANKQTLVKRLDAEKWAQADVTPERQAVLDRLSGGRVFPSLERESSGAVQVNGTAYSNGTLGLPAGPPAQPNFVARARSGRKGLRGERRREALVSGVGYKTVGSALLLAEMAINFLQFAAHFPAIGTDVVTRLCELLRVFNSRSTQLVLGAGAIHSSANLKSISAKHLALSSQSLGLVRCLIPYMKTALATRLPPKHHLLLAQLDTVAQDYRDHRDKILSKFVSMIEELIEARSGSLKLTDWDTPGRAAGSGKGGGAESCQFTAEMLKAVTAMHNILQQQLPPEQLQAVFRRMFGVITRKVPTCFRREGVAPSTEAGRQRILDEIGFTCAELSTLRGVDASSLGLEQAINDMYGQGLGGSDVGGGGGSSNGGSSPGVRGIPRA